MLHCYLLSRNHPCGGGCYCVSPRPDPVWDYWALKSLSLHTAESRAAWATTSRSRQGPAHQVTSVGTRNPCHANLEGGDDASQPSTMSPPSLCTWTGGQQPQKMLEAPRRNLRNIWLLFEGMVLFFVKLLLFCFYLNCFVFLFFNCFGGRRNALQGMLRVLWIN